MHDCLNPIHLRHHHVHQNAVDLLLIQDFQRFQSVIGFKYFIPFAFQINFDRVGDFMIVVHD